MTNSNNLITVSRDTEQLIKSITHPLMDAYIEYSLAVQEPSWVKQYDIIRGDAWPNCNSYADFEKLPEHIQKECIEEHNYSPSILKDAIIDDANNYIDIRVPLELKLEILSFLNDNLDVVKNKKIVDLACNIGYWSIFACKNQAKEITGVDIRKENLTIAESIRSDYKILESQLKFVECNVHQPEEVSKLCAGKDTVFLLGLMYHVRNHYDILRAVCQDNVENVIIETGEYSPIETVAEPLIWWKSESTISLLAAGDEFNSGKIFVGYPNKAWFDLAMLEFGFNCVSMKKYNTPLSTQSPEEFNQTRTIYLYKKIK